MFPNLFHFGALPMKKKTLLTFAISSLFLTACSHNHSTAEMAVDNEKQWEHNTPVSTPIEPVVVQQETGWVPLNGESETNAHYPLPAENFAPVESKPLIPHRVVKDDIYTETAELNPEVVRYDRYLLVDSKPQDGQKYLLEQMVTVNMKGLGLTVENGMWNTLNGTGYTLCSPVNQAVSSLFGLALPNVHYKFGPVRLRDAMQMLAGEAYSLTVNDALRQVCYSPRMNYVPTKTLPKTLVYADSET